jgi:hypothetical protein
MNRSIGLNLVLAALAACTTHASPNRPSPVEPLPPPVRPLPVPPAPPTPPPPRPAAPDLTPRKGLDYYPPCTETRRDICMQISKRPADHHRKPDGPRRPDGPHHPKDEDAGPDKPPPDPVSDCFGEQPYCAATVPGVGAFARPQEMWVGRRATLQFAIAPDDGVLIEELGGGSPAVTRPVEVGRCMRATLEAPAAIAVLAGNGEVRRLPDKLAGASWGWSVEPRQSGAFPLRARVEVLESVGGRCTDHVLEAYTKLVPVDVRVTVWQRMKDDLDRSKGWKDRFVAFTRSWESMGITLLSLLLLGLLIGAARFLVVRRRLARFGE